MSITDTKRMTTSLLDTPVTTASQAAPAKPKRSPARPESPKPAPLASSRMPEADFVTDMFNLLEKMHPSVAEERLELERAVRMHFGGSERYIGRRPDPGTQAARVLALFNGRNARTVARLLGISRARVYQILKQPGPPAKK